MIPAPIPENEMERLQDLVQLGLLDTGPEDRFDQLTQLAVRILGVRQAKITLIDKYRQYFKSNTNISDPREAPRAYGTCAHAINHPPLFVIPDMREDDRFIGRPDVESNTNPTRFYAAAILHGPSGHPVGTFCVTDSRPRQFRDHQVMILRHLAEIAQHELLRSVRELIMDAEVNYRSKYDDATGLVNRRGLLEMLSQEITTNPDSMMAVLLLQIDNYQKLLAAFGPRLSDQACRLIGKRILDASRAGDIIGRISDDQFVVGLPSISHSGRALFVADRVLDAIAHPLSVEEAEIRAHINIGISIYSTDGKDPEKLLQNAQIALDSNRSSSAHRQLTNCFFTPSMNVALSERVSLETELCKAIANQEFLSYYQPKNDLNTGKIIGAEALIRWKSPTRGLVSPMLFIPVAEETNLIVQIGEWILRDVCLQIRQWLDTKREAVPVAVNIAHRQLRTGKLPELVKTILEETGIPAHYLNLEITENAFIDDMDFACREMTRIADLGVEMALDDFGTGYSSLSFLRRLPVKVVKIDRAFVKNVDRDQENYAICAAAFAMAKAMNLDLVAEGIEMESEALLMRKIGYSVGQGYLFGKPMPAKDFSGYLPAMVSESKVIPK